MVPQVPYAFAMACGAVAGWLVKKYKPDLYHQYAYPLAAGLGAGEAISGIISAALTLGNIGGGQVGSQVGCPFGEC